MRSRMEEEKGTLQEGEEEMNELRKERKFCPCCKEEHTIALVEVKERTSYKEKVVEYVGVHEYCSRLNKYFDSEKLKKRNLAACKIAYYRLTDEEVANI